MGGLTFDKTYATNVFPFIKIGRHRGSIKPSALLYGAQKYALPQLKIVSPLMAICLGPPAFDAVSTVASQRGGMSAAGES
jgi:hypothetical protein